MTEISRKVLANDGVLAKGGWKGASAKDTNTKKPKKLLLKRKEENNYEKNKLW